MKKTLVTGILLLAIVPACFKVLPNHTWECPYTYEIVVSCNKYGMPSATWSGDGVETVTAPDQFSACQAVSEYVFLDHPERKYVICDPTMCIDHGPVATPQGYRVPGAHPEGIGNDAGSGGAGTGGEPPNNDPPSVTCSPQPLANACPGADIPGSTSALSTCCANFVQYCCPQYQEVLANASNADQQDLTGGHTYVNQLLDVLKAWCTSGTLEPTSLPPGPYLPPAATLNACMVLDAAGKNGCIPPTFQ